MNDTKRQFAEEGGFIGIPEPSARIDCANKEKTTIGTRNIGIGSGGTGTIQKNPTSGAEPTIQEKLDFIGKTIRQCQDRARAIRVNVRGDWPEPAEDCGKNGDGPNLNDTASEMVREIQYLLGVLDDIGRYI